MEAKKDPYNFGDDPLGRLAGGICAMADERKETCIYCGSLWYAIHFKDGVCNQCQKKNLPGRQELLRRKVFWNNVGVVIVTLLVLLALYSFLG